MVKANLIIDPRTAIMAVIEFKYDINPDNTIKQLSGELIGLKPLNRSQVIPELNGNTLVIEINRLDPMFFEKSKADEASREAAFDLLKTIFSQTLIWAKITHPDGKEIKMKINDTTDICRTGTDDKLIVAIPVELV